MLQLWVLLSNACKNIFSCAATWSLGRVHQAPVVMVMVTTNLCVPRGTRAIYTPVHLADEKWPRSCCCLHCCVETGLVTRMDRGHSVVWLCSLAVETRAVRLLGTREKQLWLGFVVSPPSNCSAVGVSVASGFSLSLCFKSALHWKKWLC